MTCKDFRKAWEQGVDASAKQLSESSEMAEHARACPKCGGVVRDARLLEKHLDLVRAAVPEVRPSLDAAVLRNYRRYLAARPLATDGGRWRVPLERALPWAAALAFAAVVAYGAIVFLLPHSPSGWANGKHRTPAGRTPVPVLADKPVSPPIPIAKAPSLPLRASSQGENIAAAAPGEDSFPRAFHSLVYCDQISCPGAMEVIRVELPAPVLGLAPTPAEPGGMVSADVLVGADGIARGIRVVE
jgi:hypothetical protein